jgi:hypothetical protein
MSSLEPLRPSCTELLLDYVEAGVLLGLTLLYLVPASIFLKRYRRNLDAFSSWMILVYLFGFVCTDSCVSLTSM